MAFRPSTYKDLVPQLSSALKSFQSSQSKFRVLQSITPGSRTPHPPKAPSESPKTLIILDSSFNPPSIAHQTLAQSALSQIQQDGPFRLLLLFSTMNADKAPSAASFDQRLTLMTIFAGDLLQTLQTPVPIDIGLTTAPYYTDKSLAISQTPEGHSYYPSQPKHIHLIGFDTLTRFFNPKYYSKFSPPLSALNPFFEAGHSLRVTLRPDDDYGTISDQKAFLQRLENGELEAEGGKREWAKQVVLVDPNPKAGVSSTRIRKAAKAGDWDVVGELCTEGVREWVKSEGLYAEDDRGSKMA